MTTRLYSFPQQLELESLPGTSFGAEQQLTAEWPTDTRLAIPALPVALSTLLRGHFPGLAISYPGLITPSGTRKLQRKLDLLEEDKRRSWPSHQADS